MAPWLWLIPAAVTEVGWVAGLDVATGPWAWAGTLVCAVVSVLLAMQAATELPASTVYILFMGLGSLGTVAVDVLVFGTSIGVPALGFLGLLLVAAIGLKLTSDGRN